MSILRYAFKASALAATVSAPLVAYDAADTQAGNAANDMDAPPLIYDPFSDEPIAALAGEEFEYRNPASRAARLFELVDGRPQNSFGSVDEREVASYAVHEYDAVLQMTMSDEGRCTATISTIEGFSLLGEGTLISTAAHCLEQRDPATDSFVRYLGTGEASFVGTYYNEHGQFRRFVLSADEIWINPLYEENRRVRSEGLAEGSPRMSPYADTALIYSRVSFPENIVPGHILPVEYAQGMASIQSLIGAATSSGFVTAAGHSGDQPHLTTHLNARISGERPGVLTSLADIVPGASGGPVFAASGQGEAPFIYDENGQPILLGVNSAYGPGTEYAYHALFDPASLQSVPFLRPDNLPRGQQCSQYGEVLATELNIRVMPDANGASLVPGDGRNTSRLPRASLFNVLAMVTNERGQEWALVRTELGDTGYVSANPAYVRISPRHCL